MDRPLRRWTRPLRFFRLEALFSARPPRRTSDRPAARPRLEVLEDRVGPGEATSGVVAAVLGVSVLDPAAAGLAIFGLTPLSPLADSPAALTTPDAAESTPIAPPIDPVEPPPAQPAGSSATPVSEATAPAVGSPTMDGDPFAPLLDTFWAPFAPTAAGPSNTAPIALEASAPPAGAATAGGSADGGAGAGAQTGTQAGPGESPPAPADIQPLQFAPPPPAPATPAPIVAAADATGQPYVLDTDPSAGSAGMAALSADYGSGGWCGTSGGSGGESLVSVTATDRDASESGDPAVFTFTRTGGLDGWLSVGYTVGGSATAGSDYAALSGAVTFGPYQTAVPVTVSPQADGLSEGDETVSVALQGGAGYQVGSPSWDSVTIHEGPGGPGNGPVVTVVATDADASERGADPGVFTLSRTGPLSAELTVSFQFGGTAASPQTAGASDYTAVYTASWSYGANTVLFMAGQSQATVTIQPALDARVEGDETVELVLQPDPYHSGGSGGYSLGQPASAALTIHDAPVITVTATDPAAREGKWDEPADHGEYLVTRAGRLDLPLTVRYRLTGDANPETDYGLVDPVSGASVGPLTYDPASGQLVGELAFAAGQTAVPVQLRARLDLADEPPEAAVLTVVDGPEYGGSGGRAYAVGQPNTATVTIGHVQVSYGAWADGVESVSSEWDGAPYDWRAVRALGTPDTFAYGDLETAWSPAEPDMGLQTIVLTFAQPSRAGGLLVRETSGNGFVKGFAFAERVNGQLVWHDGWQERRPDPPAGSGGSGGSGGYCGVGGESYDYDTTPRGVPGEFVRVLPYLTDYPVAAVSISVNTDLAPDEWEEIDAVRLLFAEPSELPLVPVAIADTATVPEDGDPITIDVLANDLHPLPAYLVVTHQPAHGYAYVDDNDTPLLLGDDRIVYQPYLDYFGSDSFTYWLTDIYGNASSATVNITVNDVEEAPEATPEEFIVPAEGDLVVPAEAGVLANDIDPNGDDLTALLASDVSHGALFLNSDGSFSYTPNSTFTGIDSFTYNAFDGQNLSGAVTVWLVSANTEQEENNAIPTVEITPTDPKTIANLNGSFMYGVTFKLSAAAPSTTGGFIVQHLTTSFGKDYYEAWRVPAGKDLPNERPRGPDALAAQKDAIARITVLEALATRVAGNRSAIKLLKELRANLKKQAALLSKAHDVFALAPGGAASPIEFNGEVFFVAARALPTVMKPGNKGGEPFSGTLPSAPYSGTNKVAIDDWLTKNAMNQSEKVTHTLKATFETVTPPNVTDRNTLDKWVEEMRKTIPTLETDP
ncbi:MAG: Ig-like domain-containing protein [Gemmataceae bacterium]